MGAENDMHRLKEVVYFIQKLGGKRVGGKSRGQNHETQQEKEREKKLISA